MENLSLSISGLFLIDLYRFFFNLSILYYVLSTVIALSRKEEKADILLFSIYICTFVMLPLVKYTRLIYDTQV